jgi:hypothetical protein
MADPRGIDLGVLAKPGFAIANMRSNVDMPDPKTSSST